MKRNESLINIWTYTYESKQLPWNLLKWDVLCFKISIMYLITMLCNLKGRHYVINHMINTFQIKFCKKLCVKVSVQENSLTDLFLHELPYNWSYFRKLNDTFGTCGRPHVGWQIDPFGHSREMASVLSRMGYDGLFFARLDYQDRSNRLRSNTTEMIWQGSPNLGKSFIMW